MRLMKRHCNEIALVVKRTSKEAINTAKELSKILKEYGLVPVNADINGLPSESIGIETGPKPINSDNICKIIVIGGDGTFLRVIQELRHTPKRNPLIMTVGAGRRCFYFDIDSSEAKDYIVNFIKNDFLVQPYFLGLIKNKDVEYKFLNEVVLVGDRAKLVRLEVHVGAFKLYDIFGDGLIISTSTGSTAYNLSAGGPVIEPNVRSFVVTPLASIQLSNRPVVVSPFALISVFVRKDGVKPRLIIDGIDKGYVERGSSLYVRLYEYPILVSRFKWVRFYERTFERKTVY